MVINIFKQLLYAFLNIIYLSNLYIGILICYSLNYAQHEFILYNNLLLLNNTFTTM